MSDQPQQHLPDDSDFDLDLDRVFTQPEQTSGWATPLPKPGPRVVAGKSGLPPSAPRDSKEVTAEREAAANPPPASEKRKVKFQRKESEQIQSFKHYVGRTPVVAPLASASAAVVDTGSHGKIKGSQGTLGLTPNKAHIMLNEAFHHTPAINVDPGAISRVLKFAALIIILAGFGYMLLQFLRTQNQVSSNPNPTTAAPGPVEAVEVRAEKAQVFLQRFLEMKSPEQKLASILEPDRLDKNVRDHYANPNNADPTTVSIEPMPSRVVGGLYRFSFAIKEVGTERRLQATVHETADGFKLDWEHLVNLGSVPWARFILDTPTNPTEMRATVQKTTNLPGNYEDGTKFRAYKISHQSGPPHLTGYVDADSRAAQNLEKITDSGRTAMIVKIFLSFDQSRDLNLVKIHDVSLDEL